MKLWFQYVQNGAEFGPEIAWGDVESAPEPGDTFGTGETVSRVLSVEDRADKVVARVESVPRAQHEQENDVLARLCR